MANEEKSGVGGAPKGTRFFYYRGIQTHERLAKYINERYFKRLGSTRRKIGTANNIKKIEELGRIDLMVQKHIEERNYLIFNLGNNDVLQIEALHKWNLDALFQLLLANHIKAKKIENETKTNKEKQKLKKIK